MKKLRIWLALLLIIALCWIDYSIFTEGATAQNLSDNARRLSHFGILAIIIPIGYWGLSALPAQWVKNMWLALYIMGLVVLLATGALQWKWQLFSTGIMDRFSTIRLFLTSPVPYFLLYLLTLLIRKDSSQNATTKQE